MCAACYKPLQATSLLQSPINNTVYYAYIVKHSKRGNKVCLWLHTYVQFFWEISPRLPGYPCVWAMLSHCLGRGPLCTHLSLLCRIPICWWKMTAVYRADLFSWSRLPCRLWLPAQWWDCKVSLCLAGGVESNPSNTLSPWISGRELGTKHSGILEDCAVASLKSHERRKSPGSLLILGDPDYFSPSVTTVGLGENPEYLDTCGFYWQSSNSPKRNWMSVHGLYLMQSSFTRIYISYTRKHSIIETFCNFLNWKLLFSLNYIIWYDSGYNNTLRHYKNENGSKNILKM